MSGAGRQPGGASQPVADEAAADAGAEGGTGWLGALNPVLGVLDNPNIVTAVIMVAVVTVVFGR